MWILLLLSQESLTSVPIKYSEDRVVFVFERRDGDVSVLHVDSPAYIDQALYRTYG